MWALKRLQLFECTCFGFDCGFCALCLVLASFLSPSPFLCSYFSFDLCFYHDPYLYLFLCDLYLYPAGLCLFPCLSPCPCPSYLALALYPFLLICLSLLFSSLLASFLPLHYLCHARPHFLFFPCSVGCLSPFYHPSLYLSLPSPIYQPHVLFRVSHAPLNLHLSLFLR